MVTICTTFWQLWADSEIMGAIGQAAALWDRKIGS
jgi:hypothetical protein